MSEVAILEQYLPRLIRTGWTSEAEARWVIRRVAQLLEWRFPAAAAMKRNSEKIQKMLSTTTAGTKV
jgi:hypothetical protein